MTNFMCWCGQDSRVTHAHGPAGAGLAPVPREAPVAAMFTMHKGPWCPTCQSIVIPPGRCVNCDYRGPGVAQSTHLPSETVDDEGLVRQMLEAFYDGTSILEGMRAALRVVRAEAPKAGGASVVDLGDEDNLCSYCDLVGRHLLTCRRAGDAVARLEAQRDAATDLARDAAGLLERTALPLDPAHPWFDDVRSWLARWRSGGGGT